MYVNAIITASAECADVLADALLAQGALAVSIEDAAAGAAHEVPLFAEPGDETTDSHHLWAQNQISALFAKADGLPEQIDAIVRQLNLSNPALRFESLAEQDWVRATQSQFGPIRINERLWIVPSWHESPDERAICLALDPGLAFGSGSHPTTRLCLSWLCAQIQGGESVLDYGCGSGILAIAATRLGAHLAYGVDIDAEALKAARANAARNGVNADHFMLPDAPLPQRSFDRVVANILTKPLCLLAPLLAANLAPGGQIALSGILARQVDEVCAAYAAVGLSLRVAALDEGWALLSGGHSC